MGRHNQLSCPGPTCKVFVPSNSVSLLKYPRSSQNQGLFLSKIGSDSPIGRLVVQKDSTTLTIPRIDLEHDFAPLLNDYLRRPEFHQEIVLVIRLDGQDIFRLVVPVREVVFVSR
jgi:hypothetical protein